MGGAHGCVHFALLCTFAFAILLHLMLHWNWVCGVVASRFARRRDGRKTMADDGARTIYGVSSLIGVLMVLGLATGLAALAVQAPR